LVKLPYPLRFEPIYEYRLWGGRRLADWLSAPLPNDGPIGEAWVLSDRDDYPSRVADGPLKGQTIGKLLEQFPQQLLGVDADRFQRFPLLLKFLDVHEMLSVHVHPSDSQKEYLPEGGHGKTEAWQALTNGSVVDHLPCFTPKAGDGIFLSAGTVHTLGDGIVVFEIQQNSDVTFRLYDWDHVDPETGHH